MQRAKAAIAFSCLLVVLGCQSSDPDRSGAAADGPSADRDPIADGGETPDASVPGTATDASPGVAADASPGAEASATPPPEDAASDGRPPTIPDAEDTAAPAADGPRSDAAIDVPPAGDGGAAGNPPGASTVCYREGTCGRDWGCVNRDYSSFGHCLPLGIAGSYCRTGPGTTACDAGLICVSEVIYSSFSYPTTTRVIRSYCRPTTGEGGSCVASECAAGTCPTSGPARCTQDGAANGRCRDTSPRCDGALGCGRDGRCHPISSGELCATYASEPFGCPEGKGCLPSGNNNTCTVLGSPSGACRPTAPRCDGTMVCRSGSCAPGGRIGDPCSSSGYCEDGAGCVKGTCVAAPPGALTAPCRPDDTCDAGLTCGPNRLCSDLFGAEGHSCGLSSKCLPGLYCSSGMCRKRVALDQPCTPTTGGPCIEGSFCSSRTGRCAPTGILGNECREVQPGSGDLACDDGLTCQTGLCRSIQPLPEAKLGEACAVDVNRCAPGTVCAGGVCVTAGGFDAPCMQSPSGPCQQELGCSFQRKCVPGKRAGETCSGTPTAPPCALPTICAARLDGTAVCTQVGYSETQLPNPEWVDACGEGVRIALGQGRPWRDDGHPATALLLPFPFRLWGSDRTQVWPSTNGFLSFGQSALEDRRGGVGLFPDASKDAIVAPFWDDLYLDDSPASDLCFKTAGTAPNRRFVIQWQNVHRFGHPGVTLTFAVALAEGTGAIDFMYRTLDAASDGDRPYADGSRAGIGLQSPNAVRYVVHDRTLVAGQGFRFTPPASP